MLSDDEGGEGGEVMLQWILCLLGIHDYSGWNSSKGQPKCNRCPHHITAKEFVRIICR
jgi:hypothetical protein